MDKKYSILYVDDEVSNLNVFRNTFRRLYNIFTAESAHDGLKILEREKIDLIISDQRMPEMTGVDFLKKAVEKYPQPNRILITAYTDFEALKDAVNEAKIFQFIQKPWDENKIQQIIDNALDIYHVKEKKVELTEKLKEQNKVLSKLNNELLELDKLKLQFIHTINHEIRTPLNGLIGATSLFKANFSEQDFIKYQELFDILEISTKRLEHFLLLAERITIFKANSYKIYPKHFQLNKKIAKTIKLLQDKISEKAVHINYSSSKNEVNCYADEDLIEICLNEILDNAVKYCQEGGNIVIKTYSTDTDHIIDVIDDGPGFSDIVLKNIYKPFITDDDLTKQGMGLNLTLISLIIEAHGGVINVINNSNQGATVQLMIKQQ